MIILIDAGKAYERIHTQIYDKALQNLGIERNLLHHNEDHI